jgi:hypothetical protein
VAFITDIKLRYSVGKAGNQPSDQYLYYNTLSAGVPYINWTGVTPDNIQSSNLKWETSTENNLALDMALFNNRLSMTFEVYDKLTRDLLIKRSLPATSGFATYWTNLGNVRNKGIEFSLTDLRIIEAKDVTWSINGNISANRNKLVYLPADNGIPPVSKDGYNFMVTEGDPIGAFYGLRYKGVFATDDNAVAKDAKGNVIYDLNGQPKKLRYENQSGYVFKGGDAIYEDLNHDGIINDLDRQQIGNANPLFDYAFGTRVTYKALSLDVFFQGRKGNDVINVARKNLENMQGGYQNYANQSQSVLRRWRKQGDITDMPRVTFDSQSHNNEGSNYFIEDASFLRLKSIALTYSLPAKLLKKVYVKNATITMNLYNWITWTKYTGQDPEISLKGDKDNSWIMGEDSNQTPVAKSVTVGLRLTF